MTTPAPRALVSLGRAIVGCRACARLAACNAAAAVSPPRRFADHAYVARPLTGFGDPAARVLIVGLAPAAHGGNRTGRVFTGDRSGDWLYAALHRAGWANQAASIDRDDGLRLTDAYVSVVVRCAPPGNRPTPVERDACLPFLVRELALLARVRVIVALGAFAWDGVLRATRALDAATAPHRRPAFGHGAEATLGRFTLVGSYHVSQQNTFTGRLTEPMLDRVLGRAREIARTTRA